MLAGEGEGEAEQALVEAARARLGRTGLDRIVDSALARSQRIGARIVVPGGR